MARKTRNVKRRPMPLTELTRIDEANVGRLGLISIQERVPDTFSSWTVEFQVEGRAATLTCDAMPKYGGVPHGLDGDIATAIMDLYVESGCPDDGFLHTTAYQILKRAGLDDSGRYYTNLKQTLYRLRTATYSASEAWRDHRRGNWTTVTFNYLQGLEFTSGDEELSLSRSSALRIRLADPIVRSIRSQYTKPLDIEFLTSLDRPLTRALYRLLDARRYAPEDPRLPRQSFSVNLIDWAAACKIIDQRSNKIRATLQGAHDELIERQYLESVDYEGRGKKQVITYRFVDVNGGALDAELLLSPLLQELTAMKVSAAVARKLLGEFGEAHVQERIQKFRRLLESGYKVRNRSALLVDVIRDQENKYPEPTPVTVIEAAPRKAVGQPARMPTLEEAMHEPETLEAQVEKAMKTIQFLLRDRLSVSEYGLLRMGMIVEQPAPEATMRAALQAKKDGTLDQLTEHLLDTLKLVGQRVLADPAAR